MKTERILRWHLPQALAFGAGIYFARVFATRWGYPPAEWSGAIGFGLAVAAIYTAAACAVAPLPGILRRLGTEARYALAIPALVLSGGAVWGYRFALARGVDADTAAIGAAAAGFCIAGFLILLISVIGAAMPGERGGSADTGSTGR